MSDPLTPYGNRPMVTPIVHAVNYEYRDFEVLRKITDGEIDGYRSDKDVLCASAARFLCIALADLIPGRRGRKGLVTLVVELVLIAAGVMTIAALRVHP